jgi:hypothetical protein
MRIFQFTSERRRYVPTTIQSGRQPLVHLSMDVHPDGETAGVDLCGPETSQRFRVTYAEAVEAADFFKRMVHVMRSRIAAAPDFGRHIIDALIAKAIRPSMAGTSFVTDRKTGDKLLIFQSENAEPKTYRLTAEEFATLVAEANQPLSSLN